MAVRLLASAVSAACLAALASGCIIREIREIHHEPAGDSTRAGCAQCASGAPGSIMADSQPPAPMVEEAGEPPAADYAWVDGYWHWDGAEWIWISGRWVPPMNDFVFVPPAYYASGSDCVYVPGYWQRGPRSPYPIRDPRHVHAHGHGSGRPGSHGHRPHIGDHRGDKPTSPPGSLGGKRDDQDGIVVHVPARPRPDKVAPPGPTPPPPSSPVWRAPSASAPPASAPARPSGPPPAQARPSPPSGPPPRVAPPPGPARVASPGPARVAPPASSPPPRAAPPSAPPARAAPPPASPPPRPAQAAGGHGKKK